MEKIKTEFAFTLPKGYMDREGNLHRKGTMRLATALDEIAPLRDHRVKSNQAYLTIIVLSRVVSRLGDLEEVSPGVVEDLFLADLVYLQNIYQEINEQGSTHITVACPHCNEEVDVDLGSPGE